ncbi:MAG TPA: glucose-6-phosphate dehydrogenase [Candidatus Dormibacteraeota bacterium]|nr:glucose-6-phosphate dehydrogenase [Candidatus Dormibacteraeota bacterium]
MARKKREVVVPADENSFIPADPCTIVIFGASGDLSRRKLVPALYGLAAQDCLARRFAIIGFARTPMTDEAFQQSAIDSVKKFADGGAANDQGCRDFAGALAYVAGNYHHPAAYQKLKRRLEELDRAHKLHGNRMFYLATPPDVYPLIIEQLHKAGLTRNPNGKSWTRIIIEKPYGRDLASARKLNQFVLASFDESQVYRIDHYLGKDTVQNLLVLRFGNGIFEPLWNRNYVDHVQITAAETLGVEQRASFYETAGATRDMIQSHVLQLTSLVAMEPPAAFDATAVRNEKIKVLQSIRPFTEQTIATDIVRGQYGPGSSRGNSSLLAGYRKEPGVARDSSTETYVAAKLQIDNWRWAGVPFYLRTGKRLPRRVSEIAIQFRRAPHLVFRGQDLSTNTLVLNVQPDEGISISFHAKLPGQAMKLKTVTMDFSYQKEFGVGERSAYMTLINDCMRGDATLFDRADGVESAWALVNPILDWFEAKKPKFPNYAAGTWGPHEADKLLERDGRHWRNP